MNKIETASANKKYHMPTMRVLKMLETISMSASGCTLTELSQKNGIPKSSLVPILRTLRRENMLDFNEKTARYTLGIKTFEIGNRYLDQFNIMDSIKQEMVQIVNVSKETCQCGILVKQDVLYVGKEDAADSIRIKSVVGNRIPAYCTGLGKALLSDFSLEELKKIYPNGLKAVTENTITDFKVLADQLQNIRETQLAYETEESNYHLQCIAVPIRKNTLIELALSVSIPTSRASDEKLKLIEMLLLNSKNNIEAILEEAEIKFHELH